MTKYVNDVIAFIGAPAGFLKTAGGFALEELIAAKSA